MRQYIQNLRGCGVEVTEFTARYKSWPPYNKLWRPLWFPATLLNRVPGVLKSHKHDVTLLQREMVSTLVTLERFTHGPRVLDVDDAVWLNRDSERGFARLVRMCDGVICGNHFVEENVRRWKQETLVLPTAVDSDRFCPRSESSRPGSRPIIGWSGLGAGLHYILGLETALAAVMDARKDVVLRVVSEMKPKFRVLDPSRVEYIPWSPQNEVDTIQEMTIGLMPTEDSLWARGKCSYKMLLYMSCGVPVVVSPVGMNSDVLAAGNVGFGAKTDSEWTESILWLLDNADKAREMGHAGRKVVEERYSLRHIVPRLADYLKSFSR